MLSFTLVLSILLHQTFAALQAQKPLHDNRLQNVAEPRWSALHIREAQWTDVGYSINITVGNPPQQIAVYLDISSPDSWLVPTTLPRKPCPGTAAFNTSQSTTFLPTRKTVDFTNLWIWGRGSLVFDTIAYGSLPAPFQPFIVATALDGGAGGWNGCPMAGIVGLAPSNRASVLNKPSHFERMVNMNLLERDLFALRLTEPTELSFGRTNPTLFTGDFTSVPLTLNNMALSGAWQTTASHLIVQDSDDGLRLELSDAPATFSTASPGIHVPWGVFQGLVAAAGFDDAFWLLPSVRCDKRAAMPNVMFSLMGQNLTLTPWDYTEFWDGLPDGPRCVCLFTTTEPGQGGANEVILGWAFLRAFYSVFDLGEGVVRFAALS